MQQKDLETIESYESLIADFDKEIEATLNEALEKFKATQTW